MDVASLPAAYNCRETDSTLLYTLYSTIPTPGNRETGLGNPGNPGNQGNQGNPVGNLGNQETGKAWKASKARKVWTLNVGGEAVLKYGQSPSKAYPSEGPDKAKPADY